MFLLTSIQTWIFFILTYAWIALQKKKRKISVLFYYKFKIGKKNISKFNSTPSETNKTFCFKIMHYRPNFSGKDTCFPISPLGKAFITGYVQAEYQTMVLLGKTQQYTWYVGSCPMKNRTSIPSLQPMKQINISSWFYCKSTRDFRKGLADIKTTKKTPTKLVL